MINNQKNQENNKSGVGGKTTGYRTEEENSDYEEETKTHNNNKLNYDFKGIYLTKPNDIKNKKISANYDRNNFLQENKGKNISTDDLYIKNNNGINYNQPQIQYNNVKLQNNAPIHYYNNNMYYAASKQNNIRFHTPNKF